MERIRGLSVEEERAVELILSHARNALSIHPESVDAQDKIFLIHLIAVLQHQLAEEEPSE